jgi:hypothetical protein
VAACAVALRCVAWPLLVDPSGRGLAWLRRRYAGAGRPLRCASMADPGLGRLAAHCAAAGEPLLVTGPLAPAQPALLGLLQRRMRLRKRAAALDPWSGLGAAPVPPGFRLFLHGGPGRAAADPLLAPLCTVINLSPCAARLPAAVVAAALFQDFPPPPRPGGGGASPPLLPAAPPAGRGAGEGGAGAGAGAGEGAGAEWEVDEAELEADLLDLEEVGETAG